MIQINYTTFPLKCKLFFFPFSAERKKRREFSFPNALTIASLGIFPTINAYIYAMNTLFAIIFIFSALSLLFVDPNGFLQTLLDGASKSATLCLSLVASHAVWMGLIRLWEDCGAARGISKLLQPLVKKLLKTSDEEAVRNVCMNFSVNLLGISGAATPYGIRAAQRLDKTEHAEYASAMLFVLNATSLQLFPTSMISLRTALQSTSPNDILLPAFLTTLFSTVTGVLLTWCFLRPKDKAVSRTNAPFAFSSRKRSKEACIR